MPLRLPAYFKWRDGRPRWEPGPGLRAKGWIGQDLRSASGDWLGLEAAIAVEPGKFEDWAAIAVREGHAVACTGRCYRKDHDWCTPKEQP